MRVLEKSVNVCSCFNYTIVFVVAPFSLKVIVNTTFFPLVYDYVSMNRMNRLCNLSPESINDLKDSS